MDISTVLNLPSITGVFFESGFPPLHPILVNFTAALIPVSLIADFLGKYARRDSLRATGWWTLLFATLVTPATAMAGWFWLNQMTDMDHPQMVIHKWLGTLLAAILIPLSLWRGHFQRHGKQISVTYLFALFLLVTALLAQGHLGGSMSFEQSEPMTTPDHHGDENGPTSEPATEHHHPAMQE